MWDGWAGLPLTNLESQLDRNRALAGYDRTHMFVMSWVYELPWGKGRPMGLNGIADKIAGGWRLNGIYSAYTGTPFTVSASGASLNAPGSAQTAGQIGELVKLGQVGPGSQYYAITSFRDPNFQRLGNVEFGRSSAGNRTNASGRSTRASYNFHPAPLRSAAAARVCFHSLAMAKGSVAP